MKKKKKRAHATNHNVFWVAIRNFMSRLPTMLDKILETKQRNQQNWTRPEKLDIYFRVIFDRYSQLLFGGETVR